MVVEKLEKALEARRQLIKKLEEEGTQAYRFFNAEHDGVPGLVIECFGPCAILQFHQGKCELSIADQKIAGRWCMDHLGVQHVYLKRFLPDRTHGETSPDVLSSAPFVGTPSEPKFPVTENRHTFLIRPYDGYSVGLFLDQRNNRRALSRDTDKGDEVLNLFAYTCAFSVYTAKQGAKVTSVDISQKYLDWGKENFAANGIAAESHRFFCADARYFLKAAIKRQEKYNQIILDPPSFARGKKNEPFSVKRNLGEVLEQCAQVLAPEGTIFVSTNFSQWEGQDLEAVIHGALGNVKYLTVARAPEDFANGCPILYRLFKMSA